MAKPMLSRFRRKRTNFSQVSNTALHDDKLSLKAKGLYALIQSKITMPDGELEIWKFQRLCKEGEKAFQSAWKELKDCGYLKQYRMPTGKNGRFRYEYDLLDEPDLTTTGMINLNKYGEISERKEEVDHIPQNGGSGENEPDHPPHFAPSGQSTPCLLHPVANGGGNSNTIPDNIVLDNTESVSLSNNDGTTDFLYAQLKEQIEYDFFEREYPEDVLMINGLLDCMVNMMIQPYTTISGTPQTREALLPYIRKVDSTTVIEFIAHMQGKVLTNVKNITSYYRSCLLNYLREQELSKMTV